MWIFYEVIYCIFGVEIYKWKWVGEMVVESIVKWCVYVIELVG